MVVTGKPLAPSIENALSNDPKWAEHTIAPLPSASAASRCSWPRISTRRRSARPLPRRRLMSTASHEAFLNHSLVNSRSAVGVSSSPSTRCRLRASSARFPGCPRQSQSPRLHAMR
jgi:hypothetical protein